MPSVSPSNGPSQSPSANPTTAPSTIASKDVSSCCQVSLQKYLTTFLNSHILLLTWYILYHFTPFTKQPTSSPSRSPSQEPTKGPSVSPSKGPSVAPSASPTTVPTGSQSKEVKLHVLYLPCVLIFGRIIRALSISTYYSYDMFTLYSSILDTIS